MTAPILLLTRPEAAARRFAAALGPVVAEVLISPVLEIVPLTPRLAEVPEGVILTSEQGAAAAARLGLPAGLPVWCVGPRTAQVARQVGLVPQLVAPDAKALIAGLGTSLAGRRLLHLRGRHARGGVAQALGAAEAIAYEQRAVPLSAEARAALAGGGAVVLPLFSPRSAALVAGQGPFAAPLTVVAISQAAAAAAQPLAPARLLLAARPDGGAMKKTVLAAL